MSRRSRTKGASGSSKTKRPPVATPAAHREFEAQLDEMAVPDEAGESPPDR